MLKKLIVFVLSAIALSLEAKSQTSSRIVTMTFHPVDAGSPYLAIGRENGNLQFWSTQPKQLIWSHKISEHSIRSIAFSADGHLLVTSSGDGALEIFNSLSGKHEVSLPESKLGGYSSISFSKSGNFFLTSESGLNLKVWNLDTLAVERSINIAIGGTDIAGFSSSNMLVFASGMMRFGVWSLLDGKNLALFQDPQLGGEITENTNGFISGLIVDSDTSFNLNYVALAMWKRVVILDLETGTAVRQFKDASEHFYLKARFSQDGREVYTFNSDSSVATWDLLTGQQLSRFVVENNWDEDGDSNSISFAHGTAPVAFSKQGFMFAYPNPELADGFAVLKLK